VQDDALATYAHKLNKDEARLDWSRPAVELERQVRAFTPWPVCHTSLADAPLKVLGASLGQDQAIGDHHHQVRAQRRQLRLALRIAQALRLHDRSAML
ncbi:hypothetical protein ACV33D_30020, partial [Pseudomonas aeruginosa]